MTKGTKQLTENMKQFTERPNVDKTVVESFLMGMSIGSVPATIENLVIDAKAHSWNNETIEAILDGILTSNGLEISDIIDVNNMRR